MFITLQPNINKRRNKQFIRELTHVMIQVCRGHFDFAQLLWLQVCLVWSLQQSLYTALHIIDFYYNFAELFYFFSSGVGFGCSSGNNAGKKGSIKFAEKVMPVFFSWNCLQPILIQVDLDSHGREVEKYDRSKLRSWKKAKVRRNHLIPKKQLWCFQLESESDKFLICLRNFNFVVRKVIISWFS